MILGISQHKLLIAVIVQSETPALSKVVHSESIWNIKSSGTYQPIMSDPTISTLISKWHVIWWVCPILQCSQPPPSDWSTCFLQLPWLSSLPIFFILTFEGLATLGQPCRQASQMDPWHWWCSARRQRMVLGVDVKLGPQTAVHDASLTCSLIFRNNSHLFKRSSKLLDTCAFSFQSSIVNWIL